MLCKRHHLERQRDHEEQMRQAHAAIAAEIASGKRQRWPDLGSSAHPGWRQAEYEASLLAAQQQNGYCVDCYAVDKS